MKYKDKREKEKVLVTKMITLYCRKNHGTKGGLCKPCKELAEYAQTKSDKCPFMKTKSFCANCKVHCYKAQAREEIRRVMRFSGPRMLWISPIAVIGHLIKGKKKER